MTLILLSSTIFTAFYHEKHYLTFRKECRINEKARCILMYVGLIQFTFVELNGYFQNDVTMMTTSLRKKGNPLHDLFKHPY